MNCRKATISGRSQGRIDSMADQDLVGLGRAELPGRVRSME
jgi:hypothetical protein